MTRKRTRARGEVASVSLEAATDAGRAARPASRRDGPRLGLTRGQALDLVLSSAESAGANAAYARILRGAADVFGRTAIEKASVEMILEASSVSRRTFYQFFEGKAAVLDALLAVVSSMWVASAQKSVSREPSYAALLRAHVDAFRLGGFLLRALIAEAMTPESTLSDRYESLVASLAHVHASLASRETTPHLRARTVATIAVLLDLGIDPESEVTETDEAHALLVALFTDGPYARPRGDDPNTG